MQASNNYRPKNGELNSLDDFRRNLDGITSAVNANARKTEGRDNLTFAAGKGVLYQNTEYALGKYVHCMNTANSNDHLSHTVTTQDTFETITLSATNQAVAANAKAARFMASVSIITGGVADTGIVPPTTATSAQHVFFRTLSQGGAGAYGSVAGQHIFAPGALMTRQLTLLVPVYAVLEILLKGGTTSYWNPVEANNIYVWTGSNAVSTVANMTQYSLRLMGYWL